MDRQKPLYRKENTRTHGVRHGKGGEWRWSRNTKGVRQDESYSGSMHSHHRHGFDYTPLFRFLLTRVGEDWDQTYSEALARLDRSEPIFWIVALSEEQKQRYVRIGESSYFSGLHVDQQNRLALVDPNLTIDDIKPTNGFETFTLNGKRLTQTYSDE